MELNKKLVNFESMNENTKLTLAEALLYTKGLAGGYGGDFPLSTASKDSIYRVPATNKFYVCTENYNGSQISAPNSNFVELSVWKNHDRLNNLCKEIDCGRWNVSEPTVGEVVVINFNKTFDKVPIVCANPGYYKTSKYITNFNITNITKTYFEITITENPVQYSPYFYWIAIA